MADQDRKAKRAAAPEKREDDPVAAPNVAEKGKALKKSIDEVIDDIDAVLEDNAEEFVKGYVQRGGE
jgi:ubiquitin-like protein Pup